MYLNIFKLLTISLIVATLSATALFSQNTNDNPAFKKAKEKLSTKNKNEFINLKRKTPNYLEDSEKSEKAKNYLQHIQKKITPANESFQENETIWTPGEFDESQAVLISWPAYAFDANGNMLEPFMDGYGWSYDRKVDTLVPIAGFATDLFEDSPFPMLYKELVKAIQPEATVWLRLTNLEDSVDVKQFLSDNGVNLYNYIFFNQPGGENSFWMRDCGPYGYYYGEKDSLGLAGALYYPGRPVDNDISEFLSGKFNYKFRPIEVETEGGNFMTDSWGRSFWSSVIYYNNADTLGRAYVYRKPLNSSEVNQRMSEGLGLKDNTILNQLYCDGGTGHIDLYLKMIDDENIITTKYPDELNKGSFPDYLISKQNVEGIKTLSNAYQRQYKFFELPLPTKDDGTFAKSCNELFFDARTYINGLTVNKTFIVPIYSDSESGNVNGDNQAIEMLKKYMPGYTIYPIDARALSVGGGEIHCITMQIPAENPIRIYHKRISGIVEKQDKFDITVNAKNRDGIKAVECYWRKANGEWNSFELTSENNLDFSGSIIPQNLQISDSIEYYIKVKSNNGKEMQKPITAPQGYFTFYFQELTSVDDNNQNNTLSLNPNPADKFVTMNIGSELIQKIQKITITNPLGDLISEYSNINSQNQLTLNTEQLESGLYFISVITNNEVITQKLIISR